MYELHPAAEFTKLYSRHDSRKLIAKVLLSPCELKKISNFYLRSGGLFVFTSSGSVMAENSGGTVNEGTNL